MKRSILKYVVISMLICITALSVNVNARDISVYYDGVEISFDVKPQIINSRTMVPLRAIFEALGASVEWDDTTKTVTSKRNDTTVELTIGQNYLKKNGEQVALDVPAQVVDSRTLVPVRAIAEAFGVDVYWRDEVKTVTIYEKGSIVYYFEMYKPDGSKANVEQNLTDKYEALGWGNTADDVKVTMYAPDGRSKEVYKSKVAAEKKVGWSLEKPKIFPKKVYTNASVTLNVGESKILPVSFDSNNVTETGVTWFSKNNSVATVDKDGKVYAKSIGNTEIVLTTANGVKTSCAVTVVFNIRSRISEPTEEFSILRERNSVGLVDVAWTAKNISGKTIKYYTGTFYYYNAVGDPAENDITRENSYSVKYIGPVEPGGTILFGEIGYCSVCRYAVLGELVIEYMDGTIEKGWYGDKIYIP